jgi:hypothetical protein
MIKNLQKMTILHIFSMFLEGFTTKRRIAAVTLSKYCIQYSNC